MKTQLVTSERCKLSVLSPEDYQLVKSLYVNENVRKFLGGTLDEESYASKFTELLDSSKKANYWIVKLKDTNEFIGLVFLDSYHDGLDIEIGYQFLPHFWGRGLAKEVINTVLLYGFNSLNLKKIVAETQSINRSSCSLLQKVGMQLEGSLVRFGTEQSKFSISNER